MKEQVTIIAVITNLKKGSKGKEELAGYRLYNNETGQAKDYPIGLIEVKKPFEISNLPDIKKGETKVLPRFKDFPRVDLERGMIVANPHSWVVVGKGEVDSGVTKKDFYKIVNLKGAAKIVEKDELRFYQDNLANISIARASSGRGFVVRERPSHPIPEVKVAPSYTSKTFKNIGAEEEGLVKDWWVVLVKPGERYGRDYCLVNNKDETLVEFIDARSHQFVSRYGINTLLESRWSSCGLDLDGGVEAWSVTGETMAQIERWLRAESKRK